MRKPVEEMSLQQRLAQPFVLRMAMQGMGVNEAYRALREAGLGYRRQEFIRDFHYWEKVVAESERMRYTPRDAVISPQRYIENDWRTRGIYQTVVRVDLYDPESERRWSEYFTVVHEHWEKGQLVPDTSQVYTRREIEAKVLESIGYRVQANWRIENVVPVMGFFNRQVAKVYGVRR